LIGRFNKISIVPVESSRTITVFLSRSSLIRFLKTLAQQSVTEFIRDECGPLAAAISYYAIFAIFPLLIFVVAMVSILIRDSNIQDDIVDEILQNIPLSGEEGRNEVKDAVQGVGQTGGGLIGLVSLIGLAWAGSGLFGALRRGLNAAFDDTETKRPFVPQKAIDLALVLGVGLFFIVSIGATAALRIIRNRSAEMGELGDLADGAGLFWDASSYLIPLVFSFFAFVALYTLVPSRVRSPLSIWPGALVGAVAFEATKLGFSFYLENFASYDVLMGSLGAAAGLLFWIYVNANIMLFGAEVAAEYPRVPEAGYEQPQLEGVKRPLRQRAWEAFRGLFVSTKRDARAEPSAEGDAESRPHEISATRRAGPPG
jgi:membrane protein